MKDVKKSDMKDVICTQVRVKGLERLGFKLEPMNSLSIKASRICFPQDTKPCKVTFPADWICEEIESDYRLQHFLLRSLEEED